MLRLQPLERSVISFTARSYSLSLPHSRSVHIGFRKMANISSTYSGKPLSQCLGFLYHR